MDQATATVASNTQALFSLQVSVDHVSLAHALPATVACEPSLLLAFQLLQYDIVLFDADTLARDSSETWQLAAQAHGQSCLFECNAQRLATDIQVDPDAALVLLMLEKAQQRAKLIAFSCVRLEMPHIAMDTTNRPRVSEWISVHGTWPLTTHQAKNVGTITASVTLSCLGKVLAPHVLRERLLDAGVQVHSRDCDPVAPSPRSSNDRDEVHTNPQASLDILHPPSPVKEKLVHSPSPVKPVERRRDAAVQCEVEEEEHVPRAILIRKDATRKDRIVDELDRIHHSHRSSLARGQRVRISHDLVEKIPTRHQQSQSFLEPDLPPPLFFHKPKQTR